MIDSSLNISNLHLVVKEYKNYLILKNYASNTLLLYLRNIDDFVFFLQRKKYYHFAQVDKNTFYKYIKYHRNTTSNSISNRTINVKIAAINSFLKFVCKNYECCRLAKIPQLKFISNHPLILEQEDMLSLFKNKNPSNDKKSSWVSYRNYAIAILCYSSGARISEALNINSIDIDDNWVRIDKAKNRETRYVPINIHVHIAINNYKEQCPYFLHKYLWLCSRGKKLKISATTMGIKNMFGFSPHYFRHAFATHLILNGCDLLIVKDFLGHSCISTTSIYTHIKPKHLKDTVEKFHPLSCTNN